jgi:hypothetical protein
MQQGLKLEYFILRYAPNGVSNESINIGLVLTALGGKDFGEVCFLKNWEPVLKFDPDADLDLLQALADDIQDQIRSRATREPLLQQMKESFSTSIQLSPPQVCISEDPLSELEQLRTKYLPE